MTEERRYNQAELNETVQAALANERRQIARWRKDAERLAELEAASAEGEPEAVTTNHNHEAIVATAESTDLDLTRLIHDMAGHAGARDASIVAALIDREAVVYDEHGAPSNLAELVDGVLSSRAYLRAPATAPPRMNADQGARTGRTTSAEDALRLMQTAPAEFGRMVARGLIPRDIFSGTDR